MGRHSTAHYFLEGLVDLGVEYIFANLGTDHVSLIEEMARWDKEGRKHPDMILCPHEVVAVHMAGGYALATGRAQAVLVHVDAGTANACMAIQNLFRYRLPVLLFAGRAPHTLHGELTGSRDTYVHFVQDPFDIASIVRPYVKWEYSLPSGVVVKEALARASAFAQSDPPGPVYMMLPRETLAEEWDETAMPSYPPARYGSVHTGGVEPARAETIAHTLMAAENPIAFAAYLGRKPQAVAVLDRLARATGIRVAEFNAIDLNIPQDSPCFRGLRSAALARTGRSRPAARFRRAVRAAIRQAGECDEMDPDRRRSAEGGFSDVGISDRHAHPGRLRYRAAAGARRGRSPRRRRLSQARLRSHRELGRRTRGVCKTPRRR
jgi:acetolactate synthase-1/2/3 large subunit